MDIRLLKASEIECRVQSVKDTGCILLLYKDARCDMKILDETFGIFGWEREHQTINGKLFCTVRIWDEVKNAWISKQDVGTESNTEATKGESSDSFKRACFNIGVGRELYTAPFIWITLSDTDFKEYKGKKQLKTTFTVKDIGYDKEREINYLIIVDDKGKVRYELTKCSVCGCNTDKEMAERTYKAYGKHMCKECGIKESEKRKKVK